MTDNRIEVSSVSDNRIARYSSDSIKKSLSLAKKLSNPEKDDNYYFNLGVAEYKQQSYETALHYFDRTIEINSQCIDAYFYRGYCNQSLGYYQEGITDFSQFIELTHDNTNAYYWRAVSRYKLGDYQGAVDDYSRIITLETDNIEAYLARARIKDWKLEDYYGAIDDYTQIITINPDNIQAYLEGASAKNSLENFQGTIADCNLAISKLTSDEDDLMEELLELRNEAMEQLDSGVE